MSKSIVLVCRLVLGAIFVLAGIGKVINPAAFAQDIDNYRMLPYLFVTLMAIVLPWVEIIVGLLLIFGRYLLSSSLIVMALNFVFIIAITVALARGLDIDCGCFSITAGPSKVGVVRLIEDVFFLVMAAVIFLSVRKKKSVTESQ